MQSTTDPDSGQQSREGKPDGCHYSEHRTVDSAHNVIVNVHVEPANINDVTPMPEILNEIEARLDKLPKYMGPDAGYHNAGTAHLLETKSIQEAKVNHGLRYARMLGIQNMREQCFLTAAVQNIKRLVASLLFVLTCNKPCILSSMQGLSMLWTLLDIRIPKASIAN